MNTYNSSEQLGQSSTYSTSLKPSSIVGRLGRLTNIALSSIGFSIFAIGTCFASVNDLPEPTKFEQNTTIRSFNETTTLAEELWASLTIRFVDLYEKAEYNAALSIAERTYDIAMNNFGLNDVNTADTLLKLGIINQTLGNLSVAEDHLLGSLVILEEQLSPDHPDVAVTATNLGNIYYDMKRFRDSERYHQLALRIRQNAFGNTNPVVAQSTYNLAVLYEHESMYGKAELHYKKAIALWSKSVGPTHPYVGNALSSLTHVYTAQFKYKEAANVLQQTVTYKKATLGEQHEEVAQTLINLGTAYLEQGKFNVASSAYAEALNIAQNLLTSSDPQLALLMYTLANIYHMQARMSEDTDISAATSKAAEKTTDEMNHDGNPVEIAKNDASNNPSIDTDQSAQQSNALLEQALPLYKKAAEILDSGQGNNGATLDVVLTELAMLYKTIGNTDMATATESRLSAH
ncbi:MAG: tetratricopeptide repeat protein [Porticoccus sp.]|nr:tetratricopeptide repeat protein [Porticoccus sp.]